MGNHYSLDFVNIQMRGHQLKLSQGKFHLNYFFSHLSIHKVSLNPEVVLLPEDSFEVHVTGSGQQIKKKHDMFALLLGFSFTIHG